MGRPKPQEAMIRNARAGQPFTRVEIPRTTCPRCQRQVHVVNGLPAYHLRASTPADDNFDVRVPTMCPCQPADYGTAVAGSLVTAYGGIDG